MARPPSHRTSRTRWTPEQAKIVLAELERSGMSPRAFAARRGERIDAKGQGSGRQAIEAGGTPAEFFAALASHWKRHYAGWTAWVLAPEMKLPSLMRLKESRRVPLWNGPIECRLFRFDMVAGSARPPPSP